MRIVNRNSKRLSAEVFSSAQKQPKQNASSQNREENGSTTLRNTREKPLLAGYHHRIRGQKKIAFSYSDPGGTLENKLNDLKPSFSRNKSLTFQKGSKKMILHWIANLADQNIKQQQLKINMRVTYPYLRNTSDKLKTAH